MADSTLETTGVTDTQTNQAGRTYTQEEFDNHMAGLKRSLQNKYEKAYSDLGDIEELRQMKQQAEALKEQEAIRKGEFEKVLKEKTAKWQSELEATRNELKEYKVNTPLVEAAAKYKAVAPQQVKQLLANRVRINEKGSVEVLDETGTTLYDDSGNSYSVDKLVKEFLDANPHFITAGASTTNTRSSVAPAQKNGSFDINQLDLTRAEHRKIYKEARDKGLI